MLRLLLDRVPLLAIGSDHFEQDVLVLVVAGALLDADLAHEAQAVEVGVRRRPRLLRRFRHISRLDVAGAFEKARSRPRVILAACSWPSVVPDTT